jgi:hypothetical protein
VTPRGLSSSHSGCTVVLVAGAINPSFKRDPNESGIDTAKQDESR